jgi:hypothetical protein
MGVIDVTNEAIRARKIYHQNYQHTNRDKLNEYQKKWRSEHPEKVRQYNEQYWERKSNLAHQGVQ